MSDKFEDAADEELILRQRDGESEITDYIMNKYKNMVRSKAKAMFILGADRDDLIQEGMIGLFKAIRDYDSGRDASFYTFADLCVSRQMYTAVQASRRQKHVPLNNYVSLYSSSQVQTEGEETFLFHALSRGMEDNPEKLMIDRENLSSLESTIGKELSSFEKEVLDLYITGMSYSQIAKVLGRDEKSTDNAVQRMRWKLKRLIRDEKQS